VIYNKHYFAETIRGVLGSYIMQALVLLTLCPGGHLLDRLQKRAGKHLPAANIYRIFGQILSGLRPLHEYNPPVVHRDLKLENVLFGAVRIYIDRSLHSDSASCAQQRYLVLILGWKRAFVRLWIVCYRPRATEECE
jgi:serine/threonine protein kinase